MNTVVYALHLKEDSKVNLSAAKQRVLNDCDHLLEGTREKSC